MKVFFSLFQIEFPYETKAMKVRSFSSGSVVANVEANITVVNATDDSVSTLLKY